MSYKISSKEIDTAQFSEASFAALKSRFPDLEDEMIARFLIARNGDLQKSTDLLTKAMHWRSKRWPVLKQECVEQLSKGIVYVRGVDKEGHPIIHVNPSLHDTNNRDMEQCAKSMMWWMEVAIASMPADRSKYTILINRSGGGAADVEFSRHFTKLFQDQHPERLHKAIIHPSGVFVLSMINIVKLFLDPVTRSKIAPIYYFYGVQDLIADEHIPASMGGKCTYKFNLDDYADPYPAELVESTSSKRSVPSQSTKTFFQPEDADVGNYDSP